MLDDAEVTRVLVVTAQPDDVDFGASGTISLWTDAGVAVTYCIVTDGAAGSNDPDQDLAELVRIREDEQRAACAVLGVRDVVFLGYADGTLQPTLELRRELTRLIRRLKPDRVVTGDPTAVFYGTDYINHPDHRAAAEAAIYAVFPSAGTRPIFPELLAEGFEPHNVKEVYISGDEATANTHVDISSTIVVFRAFFFDLGGEIGITGTAIKNVFTGQSGSVTPSGSVQREVGRQLAGQITVSGAVQRLVSKFVAGVVSIAGAITRSVSGKTDIVCSDYSNVTLTLRDYSS